MRKIMLLAMLAVCFAMCSRDYGGKPGKSDIKELQACYIPQPTPEETVRLELKLMEKGIYCYDLPIFDMEWRKRGSSIKISERYRDTAKKFSKPVKTFILSDLAIVYYPEDRSLGPDFLYKTPEGWVLDRTAVWDYIHYNYASDGWFAYDGNYPYLDMLKQVFPMQSVKLNNGVMAWEIER